MAVGHHVIAGISTETLCNSSKSLTLLGHLAPILFNHGFMIFLMIFVWGIIVFNIVYLSLAILYYFLEGYFYFSGDIRGAKINYSLMSLNTEKCLG